MSSSASYTLPPLSAPTPSAVARSVPIADVDLFHEADGGEIEFANGQPRMSAGLGTAVYLSLFGGNERDSGLQGDDRLQFWGNLSETDPARVYRSRTQNLLRSIPAVSSNMRRIEDAVTADLAWILVDVADAVTVVVSMPALNRVSIDVAITISDAVYEFTFTSQWVVSS